jgi:hypothetical protein
VPGFHSETQGPDVGLDAGPARGVERLNRADFERLRELGLSVSQARRVIANRERSGGFASVDELDAVPGFPREFLRQLKAELTGVAADPATTAAPREVRPFKFSKKATGALASALIGLVFAPIGFSTLAILLGTSARMDMRADPRLGGRGRATVAIVVGVVGLVVGIVLLILYAGDPAFAAHP